MVMVVKSSVVESWVNEVYMLVIVILVHNCVSNKSCAKTDTGSNDHGVDWVDPAMVNDGLDRRGSIMNLMNRRRSIMMLYRVHLLNRGSVVLSNPNIVVVLVGSLLVNLLLVSDYCFLLVANACTNN